MFCNRGVFRNEEYSVVIKEIESILCAALTKEVSKTKTFLTDIHTQENLTVAILSHRPHKITMELNYVSLIPHLINTSHYIRRGIILSIKIIYICSIY